jgi:signal transduction histidine kinase
MKAKLSHKVVLVVSIPLLFQLVFVSVFFNSIKELDAIQQAQRQTAKLMLWRNQLRVVNTMNGCYYILYRATQKKEYANNLYESIHRNIEILKKFQNEWRDDPVKSEIFQSCVRLHKIAARQFSFFMSLPSEAFSISDVLGGPQMVEGAKAEARQTGTGKKSNLELYFAELEKSSAELNDRFHEQERELKNILQLSILASIIVSVITGLLFTWSVIQRLQTVASNIRSMESHQEMLDTVGGDDEIAALNKSGQAEEFQAQTARIVANELKEPLDLLATYLQKLLDDGFTSMTADGKQRLERSLQEVDRLRTLTRDLLSLDKISRAGWDLQIAEVDLANIAATAVDTVKDFASSVFVSIETQLTEVRVMGDSARLQQIALNLLTNAIKFSKRGKSIVVVTESEGRFGKLSVTDHGTGIPDDFQNLIFGKYEQASREDSTEKGGSGLGLAISKKLIETQQGKMGFNSKLGEGSTFWFMLPRQNMKSREPHQSPKSAGEPETSEVTTEAMCETASPLDSQERIPVRPTLWLNGLLIVFLPMVLQLATIGLLWVVINQIGINVDALYRIGSIAQNHSAVMDAIGFSSRLSMLYNIEKDEFYKGYAQTYQRQLSDLIYQSTQMSQGDPKREQTAALLERLANRIIQGENDIMDAPQDSQVSEVFGTSKLVEMLNVFKQIALPVEVSVSEANKVIESNTLAKMEMRQNIETIILLSSVCTFISAVILGVMVTRKLAFRVDHVVQNTRNLIDRKPLFPPLPGTDEIAFVDRSFYEAANHLIQLEQFKQEIIAITSHEFRTPLTSLLAKVDLIQVGVFGALNESGWTVARKARKNISFLIVLITNLLDLEKIQSGKTIVSKDSVSFDDVLRKAVQEVSELSEKRLPMIEVEENNITANVDAVRLAQSISAVLREMLEYSTEDTILKIDTQAKEKVVLVTITARGKECSQKALDRKTARGRLAVDLLRAIVEQHQGATEIKASDKQLEVKLEIPDS